MRADCWSDCFLDRRLTYAFRSCRRLASIGAGGEFLGVWTLGPGYIGFGHATRVTAISLALLSRNHTVIVVSSAPQAVFSSVINHPSGNGSYRFAQLEPIVVQPKAYDVDRAFTVQNLERFLSRDRAKLIDDERRWLLTQHIHCVLIDAPFLPCAAAGEAQLPAVIVSNFTFDSCYSYLPASDPAGKADEGEGVVDPERLDALVAMTTADYGRAELLLRLPGAIPIPAFNTDVDLPATRWVKEGAKSFTTEIHALLDRPPGATGRTVVDLPLVVRPVSRTAYEPERKLELLRALRVPPDLQNLDTKILLVSFGGQTIPRPQSRRVLSNGNSHPACPESPLPSLLPPGWIALVCGLSAAGLSSDAPERFYSIPGNQFDYVPDLTAIADVVLGKLGYGTCSETLATMTPFINVPRPMFVEEYGLKRLMIGVTNLEMTRTDFEAGNWSEYIERADRLGREQKQAFRLKYQHGHSQTDLMAEQDGRNVVVDHLEQFMIQHHLKSSEHE